MSEGYAPVAKFAVMESRWLQRQQLRTSETAQFLEVTVRNEPATEPRAAPVQKKTRLPRLSLKKKKEEAAVQAEAAIEQQARKPPLTVEHETSIPYTPTADPLLNVVAPVAHASMHAHAHGGRPMGVSAGAMQILDVHRANLYSRAGHRQHYTKVGDVIEAGTVPTYTLSGSDDIVVAPGRGLERIPVKSADRSVSLDDIVVLKGGKRKAIIAVKVGKRRLVRALKIAAGAGLWFATTAAGMNRPADSAVAEI